MEINKFDLLKAGDNAEQNTRQSRGEVNIHFCSFFFFRFLKYVCTFLSILNLIFSNPFPLVTNWGGDHHSPQRKRERREMCIQESGHSLILTLHCCDIWKISGNEKKKKNIFSF